MWTLENLEEDYAFSHILEFGDIPKTKKEKLELIDKLNKSDEEYKRQFYEKIREETKSFVKYD